MSETDFQQFMYTAGVTDDGLGTALEPFIGFAIKLIELSVWHIETGDCVVGGCKTWITIESEADTEGPKSSTVKLFWVVTVGQTVWTPGLFNQNGSQKYE